MLQSMGLQELDATEQMHRTDPQISQQQFHQYYSTSPLLSPF